MRRENQKLDNVTQFTEYTRFYASSLLMHAIPMRG